MPKSFLITKLHGWKDDEVAKDDTICSADDVTTQAADACAGQSDVVHPTLQSQRFSRNHSGVNVSGINAVGDKLDSGNFVVHFIGRPMSRLANLR